MKKIRVLHFPVCSLYGGIEKYILNHWKEMDQERFQFDVIPRHTQDDFQTALGQNGRALEVKGPIGVGDRSGYYEIGQIMEQGYDIAHFHSCSWVGGFCLEKLAKEKGIPRIIVHSHASGASVQRLMTQTLLDEHNHYKMLFNKQMATDYWACSRIAGDWLFSKDSIPPECVKIMPNAISASKFAFNKDVRAVYRERLGVGDEIIIGSVGRLVTIKNQSFTIKVFRELKKMHSASRLFLVGDGDLREVLEEQARDLQDSVIFLGARDDTAQLMQAFDCLMLPSFSEGLPLVLVEAQAAGLPCFTSDVVTCEVDVTGLIQYGALSDMPNQWAEQILSTLDATVRKNTTEAIVRAGYDVTESVRLLEKMYILG